MRLGIRTLGIALLSCSAAAGCIGREGDVHGEQSFEESVVDASVEVDEHTQALQSGWPVPSGEDWVRSTVALPNCTGVIVGKRDVITAAHCRPTAGTTVTFYTQASPSSVRRTALWVTVPDGVDASRNDLTDENGKFADIAYMRLDRDIPSSARIARIAESYPGNNAQGYRVGTGQHNGFNPTRTMHYDNGKTYSSHTNEGHFLLEEADTNGGDSGGPYYLWAVREGAWVPEVQGVLFGKVWEWAYRNKYTSVLHHADWLRGLLSNGSALGCFTDGSTRALPYMHPTRLGVNDCVDECTSRGFRFAGVQAGGQCFCGDELGYSRVSDSQCNWACDGGGTGCGGSWRNDIYVANHYVGCFTDGTSRALPYAHPVRQSVAECVSTCSARGNAFAGVQAGGQCFCGDALGYTHVPDSQCNWTCDDGGTGCGGSWRNSIYAID